MQRRRTGAARCRSYPLVFRSHERSTPHLVELILTVVFAIVSIFVSHVEPFLSILAIICLLVLTSLARRGVGVRRWASLDLKETVRIYGEKKTTRLIARFTRDMQRYGSP